MADEKPLKRKGRIEPFDDADVALVAGISNPNGHLFLSDQFNAPVDLSTILGISISFPDFTDLGDTPATYPGGTAGFAVVVNGTETGLEYVSLSAGSFLGHIDTPGSFAASAGKLLAVNSVPDAVVFSDATIDDVLVSEASDSGVLSPGDGNILVENATQVRIKAGSARIVTRSSGGGAVSKLITWNDIVHTVTNIATPGAAYAIEEIGTTGVGQVFEAAAPLTSAQRRAKARLGISFHDVGAIEGVISAPDVWNDNIFLLRDALATGDNVHVVSGVATEIPATLTMETTAYVMFSTGIGFQGAGSFLKPNETEPVGSGNPRAFDFIDGDGTVFTQSATVFTKQWNNGGSLTALTGQRAVVHQILITIDGNWWVQAGTTNYVNFDQAVASIGQEVAGNPFAVLPRFLGSLEYVAVISNSAGTAWAPDLAELIPIRGSGGGGGSSEFSTAVPSLSFAHSSNVSLNASPQSPSWSISFHPTVDTEFFAFPVSGSISTQEVQVKKRGMYKLVLDMVCEISSGSYFNPGGSFYKNGVEVNGTQTSCVCDTCVNISHCSTIVELELDVDDLITPGILRFSGTGNTIANRLRFSIDFLRAT